MKTLWKLMFDGRLYHKIEVIDNKFFMDTIIDPEDSFVSVKVNTTSLDACKNAYSSKAYTEISKEMWENAVETLKNNLNIYNEII